MSCIVGKLSSAEFLGRATKTCGMRLGESVIISEHLDELSSLRS